MKNIKEYTMKYVQNNLKQEKYYEVDFEPNSTSQNLFMR